MLCAYNKLKNPNTPLNHSLNGPGNIQATSRTLVQPRHCTFWPLSQVSIAIVANSVRNGIRVSDYPTPHTRDSHNHLNQSSGLIVLLKRQDISGTLPIQHLTNRAGVSSVPDGTVRICWWAGSSHVSAAGTYITLRSGACALASFNPPAQV